MRAERERTRVLELTLTDGTLVTVNSGFDSGGLVTIALYSAADLDMAVHEDSGEAAEPLRPVVTLGLNASEAEIIGEAITLGARLAFAARRPQLKVLAGGVSNDG